MYATIASSTSSLVTGADTGDGDDNGDDDGDDDEKDDDDANASAVRCMTESHCVRNQGVS